MTSLCYETLTTFSESLTVPLQVFSAWCGWRLKKVVAWQPEWTARATIASIFVFVNNCCNGYRYPDEDRARAWATHFQQTGKDNSRRPVRKYRSAISPCSLCNTPSRHHVRHLPESEALSPSGCASDVRATAPYLWRPETTVPRPVLLMASLLLTRRRSISAKFLSAVSRTRPPRSTWLCVPSFAPSLLLSFSPSRSLATLLRLCTQGYFSHFGAVSDVEVIRATNTNRHRGFGFVTFAEPTGASTALRSRYHLVDGRYAEIKLAVPRDMLAKPTRQAEPAPQAPPSSCVRSGQSFASQLRAGGIGGPRGQLGASPSSFGLTGQQLTGGLLVHQLTGAQLLGQQPNAALHQLGGEGGMHSLFLDLHFC